MEFDRIIFNHHSLPFPTDHSDVDGAVLQFIDSYSRLNSAEVRTILLDAQPSCLWGNLMLQREVSLGQWLVEQGKKSRICNDSELHDKLMLFKKSITSYNISCDLDYADWACLSAHFQEEGLARHDDSSVLMAAEKYGLSILSMNSAPVWQKSRLKAVYIWGEDLIEYPPKYVYNHSSEASIAEIKLLILENAPSIQMLLKYWTYFFPKIKRGRDVDDQLLVLSRRPQYQHVCKALLQIAEAINIHDGCPTALNLTVLRQLGINASDESDRTKQEYGDTRKFRFLDGPSLCCFMHLKFSDGIRVHYVIDQKAFHIGYIGSHLPTATM